MSAGVTAMRGVRVAVEGCGHGKLQSIYASIETACQERNWDAVDVLIIAGDFQAIRNPADLNVMSVPAKYRKLGDFHEYYSGARVAPYLTIFVGGNHEASSYLWELYYGGWVAPNIYYMGAANIVRLGPLRIAGMSGIWSGSHYDMPHMERLPFGRDDKKSIYHVREIDIRKLLQVRTQVDIGISHDWPRAIEKHGDRVQLFKMKPHFERGSRDGSLGSPAAEYVMDRLRPPHWFSAHMHCKFLAIKTYENPAPEAIPPSGSAGNNGGTATTQEKAPATPSESESHLDHTEDTTKHTNTSKLMTKDGSNETSQTEVLSGQLPASFSQLRLQPGQPVPETIANTTVRFLALDKCLPERDFLHLCEINPIQSELAGLESEHSINPDSMSAPRLRLQYDPEWLAITRVFSKFIVIGDPKTQTPPDLGESHYLPLIEAEKKWVEENVVQKGKLDIAENFTITAPVHVMGQPELTNKQPLEYSNPQTEAFCALVGVDNIWAASEEKRKQGGRSGGEGGRRGRGGSFSNRGK